MQGVALWNMSTLDSLMSFDNAAVARMIQSVGLPFLFVPITSGRLCRAASRTRTIRPRR